MERDQIQIIIKRYLKNGGRFEPRKTTKLLLQLLQRVLDYLPVGIAGARDRARRDQQRSV